MPNQPFVANRDMYRLRSDWPWPFESKKPEKLPKAGALVFYREGRPSAFGKGRVYTELSQGFSAKPEDLDLEPYPQLTSGDFPQLLDYYLSGWAILPNFQFLDLQRGLDDWASAGGSQPTGVKRILVPGWEKSRWGHHTVWARALLHRTQGGLFTGQGLLIWYKGHRGSQSPSLSQVASFALCLHAVRVTNTPYQGMRGDHREHCSRCGLNMSYDSSD